MYVGTGWYVYTGIMVMCGWVPPLCADDDASAADGQHPAVLMSIPALMWCEQSCHAYRRIYYIWLNLSFLLPNEAEEIVNTLISQTNDWITCG